jgi:hypothetical protein
MPAQLESTYESVAALAFATSAPMRRTTTQRDHMARDIHLELLARDFVRWFPEQSEQVALAGAKKLRETPGA